jgi:hypothetical protein
MSRDRRERYSISDVSNNGKTLNKGSRMWRELQLAASALADVGLDQTNAKTSAEADAAD